MKLNKRKLFHWFFPRGFSANTVILLWSLFGGVLFHALLSNLLKMLMMPMWEEPVDTAQDVLDRGLIPIVDYGAAYYVQLLKNSPNSVYQQLGENIIINNLYVPMPGFNPENKTYWDAILENGTHVLLHKYDGDGDYHASQEILEGVFPWFNFISDKKWHFKDDLAKHILIYQQVSKKVNTILFVILHHRRVLSLCLLHPTTTHMNHPGRK